MRRRTIQEIKSLLNKEPIDETLLNTLSQDERKGVQQLLHAFSKKQNIKEQKAKQFRQMLLFEEKYRQKGMVHIAGIDEAGRGPLAGPVVAAAVILPADFLLLGLNDSKQLTKRVREEFFLKIKEHAIAYHISIVDSDEIDRINILQATKKAMRESIINLKIKPDVALIDAVKLEDLHIPYEAIEKGDAKSITIAAASILAKVTRDHIMEELHVKYPEFHFNEHMGYGTKKHLEAISQYGICSEHRKTFAPIKNQTT